MLLDRLLKNLSIEVEPFALCLVSAGWRLRLPAPPRPLIHFVLQGVGAVLGPRDKAQTLAPFRLSVVPVGVEHALESAGQVLKEIRIDAPPQGQGVCRLTAGPTDKVQLVVACGLVSVRYGPSLGLFDHLKDVLAVDLSDSPQVGEAFRGILAEQAHPAPGQSALTAALMTTCLVHMFRHLTADPAGSLPWLTALADPRLGRTVDRMLEDTAANYTVESLADLAGMSRSAFAEHFTAAFGRPPMNFLQHVRMQHAARLLQQDAMLSIDEVGSRVGYSSRSHFAEAFRKHHGVPPTAFRTSH